MSRHSTYGGYAVAACLLKDLNGLTASGIRIGSPCNTCVPYFFWSSNHYPVFLLLLTLNHFYTVDRMSGRLTSTRSTKLTPVRWLGELDRAAGDWTCMFFSVFVSFLWRYVWTCGKTTECQIKLKISNPTSTYLMYLKEAGLNGNLNLLHSLRLLLVRVIYRILEFTFNVFLGCSKTTNLSITLMVSCVIICGIHEMFPDIESSFLQASSSIMSNLSISLTVSCVIITMWYSHLLAKNVEWTMAHGVCLCKSGKADAWQ
jgi:hypothetical protein